MKQVSNKQAAINRQLHATYDKIDNSREPVCEGCGRGNRPLSHSHTISQKRCKEIRKPELISDEKNIELECFGNLDYCHDTWEHGSPEKKAKMLNYQRKIEYIKIHDPQNRNLV